MQLSVIIVSYNTAALTVQTIQSVWDSLKPDSPLRDNIEIIVVDNASHDETLAQLRRLPASHLKIIESHTNLGFSRANNLGFKSATGQLVLFLNSDTIVSPGALEKLVDYYLDHQAQRRRGRRLGLLSAQLLNKDGSLQPQGGDLPTLTTIATTMFFLDDLPLLGRLLPSVQHTGRRFDARRFATQELVVQGWVAGTAVLCQRELWEDQGGWDEAIFMYGEDQELSYRLAQAKYYHGILTTSRITHLGSASSSSRTAIIGEIKGYFYFFNKYRAREQWDALKTLLWLAMLMRIFVFSFIKKNRPRAQIYSRALVEVEQATYQPINRPG